MSWPTMRALDAERAEKLVDVFGQVGGGVAVGGCRGTAHAAQVDGDHRDALC